MASGSKALAAGGIVAVKMPSIEGSGTGFSSREEVPGIAALNVGESSVELKLPSATALIVGFSEC